MEKSGGIHVFLWLSDLMRVMVKLDSIDEGEVVLPWEFLIGSFCSIPTFVIGIWNGDDWMKRAFSKLIYGQVEPDSPIICWLFHSLIRVPFLGIFCVKNIGLYVALMVVVSSLILLFICWL